MKIMQNQRKNGHPTCELEEKRMNIVELDAASRAASTGAGSAAGNGE
jgi:hypothetical protein